MLLQNKRFRIYFLFLSIISNITLCQKLSNELLSGWGEKVIVEKNEDFIKVLEAAEKHLSSEGYDINEYDIIPFGFFKQSINIEKYRLICGVKKKSSSNPTIFDIHLNKSGNEFKILSSKNPDHSSSNMTKKDKKKLKDAIMKYYFSKLYIVKEFEIQYEYHKIDGLNNYGIYDITAKLNSKDETFEKRVLIVYRNDKTFTVEAELISKE
jgi:hypothetical protein